MSLYDVLGSKLRAEWDSRQPGTLWADTGKTVLAGPDDPVAVWSSTPNGAAHDAVQATAGSRPIRRTSPDGIDFDGVDDFLSAAHHANLERPTSTLIVVFTADAIANNRGIVQKSTTSWTTGYGLNTRASSAGMLHNGFFGQTTTRRVVSGQRYVLFASTTDPGSNVEPLLFGRAPDSASFSFDGRVHHVIVCDVLTPCEQVAALHHLMEDWGGKAALLEFDAVISAPDLCEGEALPTDEEIAEAVWSHGERTLTG